MHQNTNPYNDYASGGIALVGVSILGLGLGILFHQILAGAIIGIGAGFLTMAIFARDRFSK